MSSGAGAEVMAFTLQDGEWERLECLLLVFYGSEVVLCLSVRRMYSNKHTLLEPEGQRTGDHNSAWEPYQNKHQEWKLALIVLSFILPPSETQTETAAPMSALSANSSIKRRHHVKIILRAAVWLPPVCFIIVVSDVFCYGTSSKCQRSYSAVSDHNIYFRNSMIENLCPSCSWTKIYVLEHSTTMHQETLTYHTDRIHLHTISKIFCAFYLKESPFIIIKMAHWLNVAPSTSSYTIVLM